MDDGRKDAGGTFGGHPPGWTEAAYGAAMDRALELAREAGRAGDIPIGAVVVRSSGEIAGEGRNEREAGNDPTAHAEILALRAAAYRLGSWRLAGCTLVVTVEPCTMCAGAAVLARVDRVVFGAWEPKTGACGSIRDVVRDDRSNHRCDVIGGVREGDSAHLLEKFFSTRRGSAPRIGDWPVEPLG